MRLNHSFAGLLCAIALSTATLSPLRAETLAEPSGPHPRLFADEGTRASLQRLARDRNSFVGRTVALCKDIGRNPRRRSTDSYMGLDWAQYLQACLIAYQATGNQRFASTALVYFRALIDDLKVVGDGAGGDKSARRDSGFAIRALGPNAAIAYDWLHDLPDMDAELRARARQRFRAWTDWYAENGYRARSAGTNYHAGYVIAATLIAVAQGSEAGEDGARLWHHVVQDIFETDLLPAMRDDGVLVGGDWLEGWQYGPLSVVEYAVSASALAPYGLDVTDVGSWLGSVVLRHAYAMVPGDEALTFALGDTQAATPYIPVRAETLAAVILGPAPSKPRRWAEAEMRGLGLYDDAAGFPLFRALAEAAAVEPLALPRDEMPNYYYAAGAGTLYARFDWTKDGIWLAATCSRARDVDHTHPDAGNFVLNRGVEPLIVDPSPYGSLSTMTSNAPTVDSEQLPPDYRPSQGFWGRRTGFQWIREIKPSGILLARCDYADQYTFRDEPEDVASAWRDLIVVPAAHGQDAVLMIVDRAVTGDPTRGLRIRFRTPPASSIARNRDSSSAGRRSGFIRTLYASNGQPEWHMVHESDCFSDAYTRGNCDAARFPVWEYRMRIVGPSATAINVVAATETIEPMFDVTEGGDAQLVRATMPDRSVTVVVNGGPDYEITVPKEATTLIFLDARAGAHVESGVVTGGCEVHVTSSVTPSSEVTPLIAELHESCSINATG